MLSHNCVNMADLTFFSCANPTLPHILVAPPASARPGKRPTFTKGLTDTTVEEGGELSLQCQVQGHPEPRVIFSHGKHLLEPSSRLAIGEWDASGQVLEMCA